MWRSPQPALQFIFCLFLIAFHGRVSGQRIQPHSSDHLSINFVSVGAGIDYKAQENFLTYLKSFQKENKVTLDYKTKPWGKEGETEYIFDLKKLPGKQRKLLKKSLTEMFKENKLVRVGGASP